MINLDEKIEKNMAKDLILEKMYDVSKHGQHRPYTLSFSGITICWYCSEKRRKLLGWRQWFVSHQVEFPCEVVLKGETP